MKKLVMGLMVAAAVSGSIMPAFAAEAKPEVKQEVQVKYDVNIIREFALKQIIIQRTYLNGLVERKVLTAEQVQPMLVSIDQQEAYIRSDQFDPSNLFGHGTINVLPSVGPHNAHGQADPNAAGTDMKGKMDGMKDKMQGKMEGKMDGMKDKCKDKMANKEEMKAKCKEKMEDKEKCSMMEEHSKHETDKAVEGQDHSKHESEKAVEGQDNSKHEANKTVEGQDHSNHKEGQKQATEEKSSCKMMQKNSTEAPTEAAPAETPAAAPAEAPTAPQAPAHTH